MNIVVLGAAGFIGKNLIKKLMENRDNNILVVDSKKQYFENMYEGKETVKVKEFEFNKEADFDKLLLNQEVVYHLVSTTIPSTSNQKISEELDLNIVVTARLLEACVRQNIKKVIFISSGGTVYGKAIVCPISENANKQPIAAYGLQKSVIEDMLYIFHYAYGLDYRVVRLANPYGPYQRPNGLLGAVTNFAYKALTGEKISIFGDGKVIRDYVYIEDAIEAIVNVATQEAKHKVYNVGSGRGTDLLTIVEMIKSVIKKPVEVEFVEARKVDLPENYLDVSRYEEEFGNISKVGFDEGILKTVEFLKSKYPECR